jgi:hypothetical protein
LRSVDECYRGSNVRVFRLDREGIVRALRERARALLGRRSDVVEVRLFGSLARGEAHPGSDADLFVVLTDGAPPFLDRIPDLARSFAGAGIGCDVIAYTETERATLAAGGGAFARAVLEEGVVLAQRPRAGT